MCGGYGDLILSSVGDRPLIATSFLLAMTALVTHGWIVVLRLAQDDTPLTGFVAAGYWLVEDVLVGEVFAAC